MAGAEEWFWLSSRFMFRLWSGELSELLYGVVDEGVETEGMLYVGNKVLDGIFACVDGVYGGAGGTEVAWTHIVDVVPVFVEAFGSCLDEVGAKIGEEASESRVFHYAAVLINLIADGLPDGADYFARQTDGARIDGAVAGLQMEIVAAGEALLASRRVYEDAYVILVGRFVGGEARVAVYPVSAVAHIQP